MAKASAIEMKHAAAVEGIEGKIDQLLDGFQRLEERIAPATLEALEGTPGWGISDTDMADILTSIEQICLKTGATWETPNPEADNFDPAAFIKAQIAKIADRLETLSSAPTPTDKTSGKGK